MQYELSRQASAEIDRILEYTAEFFSPDQAHQYIDGLEHSFELLTQNPYLGRVWNGDVRRYVYRSHVVFYTILEARDTILIATIMNSRQFTETI